MLSFPPHYFHKLQALDRSVHRLLNKCGNSACDFRITYHPGTNTSNYDIRNIVETELPLAITLKSITAGFQMAGIYSFNREIFLEEEFVPSNWTDRPESQPELPKNE